MNKGQEYYFTKKGTFGTDISSLGIGIKTQTVNYVYHTTVIGSGTNQNAFSYAILNDSKLDLKSYSGLVSLTQAGATSKIVSILCETKQAGVPAIKPISSKQCAPGSIEIGRTSSPP